MARSISEEEMRLRKRARRRLIGAIALTTLVIVTLPMVLDGEPRPIGDDIAVQIPSPNSGRYAPKGQAAPGAGRQSARGSGALGGAGFGSVHPAQCGRHVGAGAQSDLGDARRPEDRSGRRAEAAVRRGRCSCRHRCRCEERC